MSQRYNNRSVILLGMSLGAAMNWMDLLSSELGAIALKAMPAFGRNPLPVDALTAQSLLEELDGFISELTSAIPARLVDEVDVEQALLFTRRFESVSKWLSSVEDSDGPHLALIMALRCREILEDSPPRALRIRAAIDFFASQGAALIHSKTAPCKSIITVIHGLHWQNYAGGVGHSHYTGPSELGPLRINLMRVESGCTLRALLGRDFPSNGLKEMIRSCRGAAGVSGGFFLYSEPGITEPCHRGDPVGLVVDKGLVISPPFYRRATLIQRRSGRYDLECIGIKDCVLMVDQRQIIIDELNEGNGEFSAFSPAWGSNAPHWPGPRLMVTADKAIYNHSITSIPPNGLLINMPYNYDGVGGPISWRLPVQEDPIVTAMAGGPFLVHPNSSLALNLEAEEFIGLAPPITFSQDETFDQNLLPRMAVGLREDGVLFFLAVDGREPLHAPGLRLQDCAKLLESLGCYKAINLDGGSSKRMFIGENQVDRSSTEVHIEPCSSKRIRPIYSALVIEPNSKLV